MGNAHRLTLFTAALCISAVSAQAQVLSIGTPPQGAATNAAGSAIAKVLSEKSDFRMRVSPRGGPNITIPLMNNGELEFVISHSIPQVAAAKGTLMFKGRPQSNIRMVGAFHGLATGFMVRADSKFKTIADLKGARVSSGFVSQKVVAVLTTASLSLAGLTKADVEEIAAPNTAGAADDLVAGKADAHINALTSGKSKQTHAAVGIRWLPVPDTEQSRSEAARYGLILKTIEPGGNYAGIDQPILVTVGPNTLTANANVPEDTVYEITKLLHTSKDQLVAAFGPFAGFDPKDMAPDLGIPYHPGALRYYREAGLMP